MSEKAINLKINQYFNDETEPNKVYLVLGKDICRLYTKEDNPVAFYVVNLIVQDFTTGVCTTKTYDPDHELLLAEFNSTYYTLKKDIPPRCHGDKLYLILYDKYMKSRMDLYVDDPILIHQIKNIDYVHNKFINVKVDTVSVDKLYRETNGILNFGFRPIKIEKITDISTVNYNHLYC
uniref:Uncharacterized protein n=1 Tax=viral metagenome TaxID=1070528 RepID=A0A6C0E8D4_9ZZZZ